MKKTVLYAISATIFLYSSCTSTPKAEAIPSETEKQVAPAQIEKQDDQKIESSLETTTEDTETNEPALAEQPKIEEPEVFDLPPEPEKNEETKSEDEKEVPQETEPIVAEMLAPQAETIQNETPEQNNVEIAVSDTTTPETENKDIELQEESAPKIGPDVIAEANADAEQEEPEPQEEIEEPAIPVPSRSITIKKSQYLDVVYPGSGWIYMGEIEKEKKLVFFGRKIGADNTAFTLRSRFPGTTLLHFYKNDILTGNYIDDYLEVVIEDETATSSSEHIQAPSYAEIVPPKPNKALLAEKNNETEAEQTSSKDISAELPAVDSKPATKSVTATQTKSETKQSENQSDDAVHTVIQNTDQQTDESSKIKNEPPVINKSASTKNQDDKQVQQIDTTALPASDILKKAQEAYDSKQYTLASSLLMAFFEKADTDIDKALFLQGQTFEAKSSVQDIKSAIDAYDTIVKNYPQSQFWKKANERSMYLKRFYIDIR